MFKVHLSAKPWLWVVKTATFLAFCFWGVLVRYFFLTKNKYVLVPLGFWLIIAVVFLEICLAEHAKLRRHGQIKKIERDERTTLFTLRGCETIFRATGERERKILEHSQPDDYLAFEYYAKYDEVTKIYRTLIRAEDEVHVKLTEAGKRLEQVSAKFERAAEKLRKKAENIKKM